MLSSGDRVAIRNARPRDAGRLVKIFADSWRQAYTGIIPHHHLQTLISRRHRRWWARTIKSGENIIVVDVNDTVAGYATFGPARAFRADRGEVYEIYLDPTHQGLGFGELLFEGCRVRLDRRKRNGLLVMSLSDNAPAIDFYWRRGGRPIATTSDTIGGAKLQKIIFAWD